MAVVEPPKVLCDACPAFARVMFVEVLPWRDAYYVGVECHDKQFVLHVTAEYLAARKVIILSEGRVLDAADLEAQLVDSEQLIQTHAERMAFYQRVLKGLV